jgi:hypothetical protein
LLVTVNIIPNSTVFYPDDGSAKFLHRSQDPENDILKKSLFFVYLFGCNAIHASEFSGEDGSFVKFCAVSKIDIVFSYG